VNPGHRLVRYLTLFLVFALWSSNVCAYVVTKTNGGADIKWFTPNATYYINSSGGPSGNLAAFQAAMQTWTDVVGSAFIFIYGGTTTSTACGTYDSSNRVCYVPMGLTGTLAENTFWYNTSSGQIVDSDIKFNTDYSWATNGSSGAYDIQNVATHELGHSLSLADLYNGADSEKTMYGYAGTGETKKRTLDQDDINGIAYLYPEATPPTGSVIINAGAMYAISASVTLTLNCSDVGSGCSQMEFSNDNTTWSSPEAYATPKSWTLLSGDGTRTVYTKFRDGAGNWSGAYTDTIVLDATVPVTTPSPAGGTYASAQNVILTCNDGSGSGCSGTKYCLGTGCTPTITYSGAINISGSNTLRFSSADNAGNNEIVRSETYTIAIPLAISTSSLPSGALGTLYSQTLTAAGGVPPYTWAMSSGNLPDGLNLSSSGGMISGTPTTEGTFSFTVRLTDYTASTAIRNLSITINHSQELPVKIAGSYYSSVQEAYDGCSDGDILQIQAADIYEDLIFDSNVSITLQGGYNSDFTDNSSYTIIHDKITIVSGKVVTERIVIQ
jgi:hypothetical protein